MLAPQYTMSQWKRKVAPMPTPTPLHGGEQRLVEGDERLHQAVVAVGLAVRSRRAPAAERGEIDAGREVAAGARHHHGRDVVVCTRVVQRVAQRVPLRVVEGVLLARAIQGEQEDAVLAAAQHALLGVRRRARLRCVRHGSLPEPASCTGSVTAVASAPREGRRESPLPRAGKRRAASRAAALARALPRCGRRGAASAACRVPLK